MPVLACFAAFPLFFALFWRAQDRPDGPRRGWDEAFVLAAVFWAASAVIITESLSSLAQLNRDSLLVAWVAVDIGLVGAAWASWRRRGWIPLRPLSVGKLDAVLAGILGAYLLGLAAVAWVAPPNNVDSLQYHMARVVHWAQQASLAHYRTGYGPQVWYPPGAEILILNLRLLVGDDRLAGFVQWFSYLASLVGVWWIGKVFGLGRPARWVALGFAASIPMAVLQATSTQNDMVVAFWIIALAGLVASVHRRSPTLVEASALGAALGIGLLSKATFYFSCAPLVLWLLVSRPWRQDPKGTLARLSIVVGFAVVLNAGHLVRNVAEGWTPLGPAGGLPVQSYGSSVATAVGTAFLRPVQAALLNFATPDPDLNNRIVDGFAAMQRTLGVGTGQAVLMWDWNHEDAGGSPIHFLIILGSLLCLVLQRGWPHGDLIYAACLAAGFVLMPIMVEIATDPLTIRYQLTFLVASGPLVALVLGRYLRPRALDVLAVFFLVSALPWVLFNKTRPVIGMRPDPGPGEIPCLAGCTAVGSVFRAPKADIVFANLPHYEEGYVRLTDSLRAKECRQVGLRIDSHEPEYALWYLLEAPQSGFHLETVYAVVDPEPLRDRDFRPCAIICTICGDRSRLHGLDMYSAWQGTALYLGDGFTWDEDG